MYWYVKQSYLTEPELQLFGKIIEKFFLKQQLEYVFKSPEICFRTLFQRQKARIHNNYWAGSVTSTLVLTLECSTSSRRISAVLQHSTCPYHQISSCHRNKIN